MTPRGRNSSASSVPCAHLDLGDERRPDLQSRELQLLAGHHNAWARPVSPWVRGYQFRRGFVEAVKVQAATLLHRLEELFGAAPIRELQVSIGPDDAAALAASPYLGRLRVLTLNSPNVWTRETDRTFAFATILGFPHLGDLRALGVPTIGGLLGNPILGQLDTLDLKQASLRPVNYEALIANGNAPPASTGRVLSLCPDRGEPSRSSGGPIAFSGNKRSFTRCIVRPPPSGRIRSVAGVPSGLHRRPFAIDPFPIEALLENSLSRSLRVLELKNCFPQRTAHTLAVQFATHSGLAGLVSLGLSNNPLDTEGIEALGSSPYLGRLQQLTLAGTGLGERTGSLTKLLHSPLMQRLIWLDLRRNRLDDSDAAELCNSGPWPKLAWLDLRGNNFTRSARTDLRQGFGHAVRY